MSDDTERAGKAGEEEAPYPDPLSPPDQSLQLYRLLWQLEGWLRQMVYVELRARDVAWETEIQKVTNKWPPHSLASDKRFTHMATAHQSAISYLSTGEVLKVVGNNWDLFASYLPPRDIFDARVKEVEQIRHRVAHFRSPHESDIERLSLFLRDIDKGLWRFCTSYSGDGSLLPPGVSDPVSEHFVATHSSRGIVEMRAIHTGTHHATIDAHEPVLGFYLTYSMRPWASFPSGGLAGAPGVVYHARFVGEISSYRTQLRMAEILDRTLRVHPNVVHVRVERHPAIEITVPGILGAPTVIATIERFLESCCSIARRGHGSGRADAERLAAEWPEYVLPGSHPLGFLGDDMPCSMFTWDLRRA